MLKTIKAAALGCTMLIVPAVAYADPAIIYDIGGKFDKSFNEMGFTGAQKATKELGIKLKDFEVQSDTQREQALRKFAKDGYSPIVVAGFMFEEPLKKVAAEFPKIKFTIIDDVVDLPNVRSVVFKENEGSYLVGVAAALTSKTGKVGFVGGMDIPIIRKFACGYVIGAKAANPKIEVLQNMTGTTGAAFADPVKGAELTKSQIDRGADVVFHAAGATGLGVLQAAADAKKLGIGVDANQNYIHPGFVLTSMQKHVEVAVYDSFVQGAKGTWTPGVQVLGLKENGVGWALDSNNAKLITPEVKAAVEKAKADIIAGTVKVHNYMDDNACPAS